MIHDFATFPKQPVETISVAKPVSAPTEKRRPIGRVLLLCVLVVLALYTVLSGKEEAPQEYSPGVAEALEYEQSVTVEPEPIIETNNEVVSSQPDETLTAKNQFEMAVKEQEAQAGEYGFYDSLSSSPWQVPIQEGVYFTEADRRRASSVYILQAASMRHKEDAARLVAKLRAMKLPASYSISESDYGGVWYRVNVGPYSNSSIMNKAEDRLVAMSMMPLKKRVR